MTYDRPLTTLKYALLVCLSLAILAPAAHAQDEPPDAGAGTPEPGIVQPSPTPAEIPTLAPPVTEDSSACANGRMRIGDLVNADQHMMQALSVLDSRANAWQPDAELVELRMSCPLLKTGVQWEGSYFSATAQAMYATDTFDVEPSELAPDRVPYLDVSGVSFQVVHRSLLRAGYSDDLQLATASSVTVRRSTDDSPFGPQTAPRGVVYVHVAVEDRGVVRDVWINAEDGTIYRYDLGG